MNTQSSNCLQHKTFVFNIWTTAFHVYYTRISQNNNINKIIFFFRLNIYTKVLTTLLIHRKTTFKYTLLSRHISSLGLFYRLYVYYFE